MSTTERVLMLLRVAGDRGLADSVIGDICQIASHDLAPVLWRLLEHGHIALRYEGIYRRRAVYLLAPAVEAPQQAPPRWHRQPNFNGASAGR